MWSETADSYPDAILTSKWNKPFPVMLIPFTLSFYIGRKQRIQQAEMLDQVRALAEGDLKTVRQIAVAPKSAHPSLV